MVNGPLSDLSFFLVVKKKKQQKKKHTIRDHKSGFGFSTKYAAPESVLVLLFLPISKALLFVNRSDLGRLRFVIGGFQSVWFVSVSFVCVRPVSGYIIYN